MSGSFLRRSLFEVHMAVSLLLHSIVRLIVIPKLLPERRNNLFARNLLYFRLPLLNLQLRLVVIVGRGSADLPAFTFGGNMGQLVLKLNLH